jgi:hypothetical protein
MALKKIILLLVILFPSLHLTSIALLPERKVQVIATQTDPISTPSLTLTLSCPLNLRSLETTHR